MLLPSMTEPTGAALRAVCSVQQMHAEAPFISSAPKCHNSGGEAVSGRNGATCFIQPVATFVQCTLTLIHSLDVMTHATTSVVQIPRTAQMMTCRRSRCIGAYCARVSIAYQGRSRPIRRLFSQLNDEMIPAMNTLEKGLTRDPSGMVRCAWCVSDPMYIRYHDREWGFPVHNDTRLFEKICLEGFQSGLSWITILRKRDNFRAAFASFDIPQVAAFSKRDVNRLLKDAGIIRHRGKIESTINNAKRALEMIEEFGSLASYVWRFETAASDRPKRLDLKYLCANTTNSQSIAMSKDLKKRGWSFVGPTTIYAFMQAMGLVNDHLEGCEIRQRVEGHRAKKVSIKPARAKPPMKTEKR
jgi:DNA-3-methyladenine glycosylase I